ncbi:MAG: hypothetical protein H6720_19090 [Sandaracinus sp.]|nr:hypothetical protein [Sandaracinus sp.]
MTEARGASSGLRKVARCLVTLAETLSPRACATTCPRASSSATSEPSSGCGTRASAARWGVLEREGLLLGRGGAGSIEELSLDGLRAV